jgi:flagella basal body P-ring formation protein FlgA
MILAAAIMAACVVVSGGNITAGDLAKAIPAFTPQDPAASIGYAPSPGLRRAFHPAEVQRVLAQFNSTATTPLSDICFERQTAPLSNDAVAQAMHHTLGPDARIEIVEISKFPAPPGEVIFPLDDLGMPPIALWRGYVRYDGDKKFRVWARVKITVQTTRLIAVEELKPGSPIKASQVALQKVDGFPERRTTPGSLEEAIGCLPRRFISPDSPVWKDALNPPNDIAKGDQVTVTVRSGQAQLSFGAEAETSGRRGDLIAFKNPDSGKTFRARIQGPGKAGVETPSIIR